MGQSMPGRVVDAMVTLMGKADFKADDW